MLVYWMMEGQSYEEYGDEVMHLISSVFGGG